jgi:hypothetical protein
VENGGNPMVMGFQDEIDDEDYRPTVSHVQPQQVDSDSDSDDEPPKRSPQPQPAVRHPPEEVPEPDDLDDWLNSGDQFTPAASISHVPALEIPPEPVRVAFESPAEVEAPEAVPSTHKEHKSKKSSKSGKKKTKKSKKSKESSESREPEDEDAEDFSPRPHGEYEEI